MYTILKLTQYRKILPTILPGPVSINFLTQKCPETDRRGWVNLNLVQFCFARRMISSKWMFPSWHSFKQICFNSLQFDIYHCHAYNHHYLHICGEFARNSIMMLLLVTCTRTWWNGFFHGLAFIVDCVSSPTTQIKSDGPRLMKCVLPFPLWHWCLFITSGPNLTKTN